MGQADIRGFALLWPPAIEKNENKSIIMDFCGLKCCQNNRFPCYVQTKKIGLKMDYSFFLAKTKCIIVHLESIIMDFIISRKSH